MIDDDEDIRPTKSGRNYSSPGMKEPTTAARYSPAFKQQRPDGMQARPPREDQVRRDQYLQNAQQRNSAAYQTRPDK